MIENIHDCSVFNDVVNDFIKHANSACYALNFRGQYNIKIKVNVKLLHVSL